MERRQLTVWKAETKQAPSQASSGQSVAARKLEGPDEKKLGQEEGRGERAEVAHGRELVEFENVMALV